MPCLFVWDDARASGSPASHLLALLSHQAADAKAAVRKGAVQLLTALQLLLRAAGAPADLQATALRGGAAVLRALAADPMLSVRRAVVDAAAALADADPLDEAAALLWAGVALPLLQDAEAGVQEAVQNEVRSRGTSICRDLWTILVLTKPLRVCRCGARCSSQR